MNYYKASLTILVLLSVSRFIPHPPNFTSLIALSFYVPVIFGYRYIPVVLISFAITDLIIGFHNLLFFTWGSVVLVGLISNLFKKTIILRIFGAISGAILFFITTNFGVWTFGSYGYTINGLVECYTLAIPFFTYNVISTILFSSIIEFVYYLYNSKKNQKLNAN